MSDSPDLPVGGADRLAKVMARAGLCSRRDAELWIKEGRVAVNGKKVMTPAFNVTEADKITVNGEPLAARQGTRVWLYHKPAGLVVTEKDPEGRETIFEALEKHGLPRVVTIGRLDINTEGLLLLTNDGGLKRVLELPATGWLRKYRVRAFGSITQEKLDTLKAGMEVDGIRYGPIEAVLERSQGSNVWMEVALREGKNREVKNVLGALGLEVNRLIRISYGPFQLNDLAIGAVEAVKARVLRDQLGRRLAEESGADFDSAGPESPLVTDPKRRVAAPGSPPPRQRRGADTDGPRFRFTDRADQAERERPPAESRARPERPGGRFAGRGERPRPEPVERAPRTMHFDDGRESETFTPRGFKTPVKRDRDDTPARSYGLAPPPKPRGPRADAPDRPDRGDAPGRPPRGPRPDGAAPRKPYGDKPARAGGDRPGKSFDRPAKPYGDRPARPFGDRPAKPFGERSSAPRGDRPDAARPRKPYGDRPARPFGDRDAGDRPVRSFGNRPDGPRPERSSGPRPERSGPRPERSSGPRPERSAGPRPERPAGPRQERPVGGRPERSFADRQPRTPGGRADRAAGATPERGTMPRPKKHYTPRPGGAPGGRPERSAGARPAGARPAGARPGKPAGQRSDRSGGPRPPRKPRV
jgi:23S rRNA pseudouridine2605 synthase